MRLLIDADGCPVTKAALKIAGEQNIAAIIFCDTSHVFNFPNAKVVIVEKGADSADFALVNEIEKGDIVITQDYGLAAMALSKKGIPITQNGLIISDENLNLLLNTRYIAKKKSVPEIALKAPQNAPKNRILNLKIRLYI